MSDQLTQLERLQAELHQVNQELIEAARPLERLDELNEEKREQVAARIRERLARWDTLTQEISQVLRIGRVSSS